MADQWREKMGTVLQTPVPHQVFIAATEAYARAARGDDPKDHLPGGPKAGDPPGGYYLSNIPMNRGMMAVMREGRALPDDQRQALGFRVMQFGEALEAAQSDSRFTEHLKPGDEPGAVNVSEALMRALAECRFILEQDNIAPDMDDLYRIAEQHRLAEGKEP